jgi:hypothetical protein
MCCASSDGEEESRRDRRLDRFGACSKSHQERVRETGRRKGRLFVAVGDSTLCQVIRRHLKGDTITGENSYAIASEFASEMSENRSILI